MMMPFRPSKFLKAGYCKLRYFCPNSLRFYDSQNLAMVLNYEIHFYYMFCKLVIDRFKTLVSVCIHKVLKYWKIIEREYNTMSFKVYLISQY